MHSHGRPEGQGFSPAVRIWLFGVDLSLCLSFLAYFWHIFRPLLDAFWVCFLGTFVDSKGLLRFVPLDLTSFVNFLRVSGTFAEALLEHSVIGIPITLTSRGSSLMKISPTSLASQGRCGLQPRQLRTASSSRSMLVGYLRAAHLSRPSQSVVPPGREAQGRQGPE